MNVYSVWTPDQICFYPQTEIDPAEYGQIHEIVAAETPNQAKSIVCIEYDLDYVETRFSIHKLAEGDYPVGSFPPLLTNELNLELTSFYIQAHAIIEGWSDIEEWEQWEAFLDYDKDDYPLPELSDEWPLLREALAGGN